MIKHIQFLIPLLAIGCTRVIGQESIIGTWKHDESGGYVIFHESGELEFFDNQKNKQEMLPGDSSRWEVVSDKEPKQLFYIFIISGELEKTPIGIYKIENGRLTIGEARGFDSSDGFQYVLPKDFSGYSHTYTKSNL